MSAPTRTCRDEVLAAFERLENRQGRFEFSVAEIVQEVLDGGSQYQESTVRTHVVSRMCANAPTHHGTAYADLERIDHGRYRRR